MNKIIVTSILLFFTTDVMALTLASNDFPADGELPTLVTCDGKDISPDLSWSDIPSGTKSFALIVEDPDARREGGFDHWVLFNLPAELTSLPQGVGAFPKGTVQGNNSSNKIGYYGPCPPTGKHRYYFKVYALDRTLDLPEGATKKQVLDTLIGHVIGQAELMGTYEKAKK